MPAVRALFLDIDGTLLDSHQRITPAVRAALLAFQQKGGVVILSSARPYIGMQPYGEELELARYGGWYSVFNGGQMVNAATLETVNTAAFTPEEARAVVEAVAETEEAALAGLLPTLPGGPLTAAQARQVRDAVDAVSLNPMTYKGDTLIVRRLEPYAAAEMLVNHMNLSVRPDFAAALDFPAVKFLISGEPGFLRQVFPALRARLDRFEAVISDPFFAEVTPKGVHKGLALEAIAAWLGIDPAETAAVGDSANDLPMFRAAGIAVAMGNAPDEVKAAAHFITRTNDEDGIAFFLDSLGS